MHKDDIFYNTRHNIVLYPYGLCNLNCAYCFIDKNPALKIVDDMIRDSFKDPNYYIDFIKEFVNPDNITFMQFWGGEPTLGFPRMENFLDKAIDEFPNLKLFTFSSNFTTKSFVDDVFVLFNAMAKHPEKQFLMDVQVSYDGPGELTDMCRGCGVAKRVWENLHALTEKLHENKDRLSHINFRFHNKETFNQDSLRVLGKSDESILGYWQDLADMKTMAQRFNMPNVSFTPTLLTMAGPTKYTVEDGIYFADFCKRSKRLMENNRNLCDYTCAFVPYYKKHKKVVNRNTPLAGWDRYNYGYCNLCYGQIGFLPNDIISVCHSSFVDLMEDYKHIVSDKSDVLSDEHTINKKFFEYNDNMLIYHKNDYSKLNSKMDHIRKNPKSLIYSAANLIRTLAQAGMVEEKYVDEGMAFKASAAFMSMVPVCYRNNFNVTGSLGMFNTGEFKLFFNGAMEVMMDEEL